jgi:hypothetical protein
MTYIVSRKVQLGEEPYYFDPGSVKKLKEVIGGYQKHGPELRPEGFPGKHEGIDPA